MQIGKMLNNKLIYYIWYKHINIIFFLNLNTLLRYLSTDIAWSTKHLSSTLFQI